jgi:hypothetical protein
MSVITGYDVNVMETYAGGKIPMFRSEKHYDDLEDAITEYRRQWDLIIAPERYTYGPDDTFVISSMSIATGFRTWIAIQRVREY